MAIAIGADGTPYQSRNGMPAANTTCKHCTGACSCRVLYGARHWVTGNRFTVDGQPVAAPTIRGLVGLYLGQDTSVRLFDFVDNYRIIKIRIRKVRKPKPSERLAAWVKHLPDTW